MILKIYKRLIYVQKHLEMYKMFISDISVQFFALISVA